MINLAHCPDVSSPFGAHRLVTRERFVTFGVVVNNGCHITDRNPSPFAFDVMGSMDQ